MRFNLKISDENNDDFEAYPMFDGRPGIDEQLESREPTAHAHDQPGHVDDRFKRSEMRDVPRESLAERVRKARGD